MEEAVSGVKGELAIKVFGTDLKQLEATSDQIVNVMRRIPGIEDLGVFRVVGQPNVNVTVDREKAARYGINVSDIQDAIEAAVGGKTVGQILDGERRFDLTVRYLPQYRSTVEDIGAIRMLAPTGERVALSQLATVSIDDGASMIYREEGSRYIAIKYSVRGRDLGSAVREAIGAVNRGVKLPQGYRIDWSGEYESQKRANARLAVVVPVTVLVIFLILYAGFHSLKWALLIAVNIAIAPIGGILALLLSHTHFSVSSGVGMLALFGVSVQIGVILVEYINQLRERGMQPLEAATEGAMLRLRPILMTMLVATLGLLPAATSHDIGSDSQRPFAIVIVGGLMVNLLISVLLLPTRYVWMARETDR